jgi:DNA polymerase (family 10)
MTSNKRTMELETATKYAAYVYAKLEHEGIKTEICGSVRRQTAEVNDIDIVVGCGADILKSHLKGICLGAGVRYLEITKKLQPVKFDCLIARVPFNFYTATEENWGAMILFLTGNQLFNIIMRGEAKKQGYKLSQYGLFHGPEIIAGKREEQIFKALGLRWVYPKDREVTNKFKFERR